MSFKGNGIRPFSEFPGQPLQQSSSYSVLGLFLVFVSFCVCSAKGALVTVLGFLQDHKLKMFGTNNSGKSCTRFVWTL